MRRSADRLIRSCALAARPVGACAVVARGVWWIIEHYSAVLNAVAQALAGVMDGRAFCGWTLGAAAPRKEKR
jgi:hypothetical protein